MTTYSVGQIVNEFKNHSEGVYFSLSDEGADITVFFDQPEEDEIKQFKSGNRFEIRLTDLYNTIMLTFKIGNLSWMDAPYTPHLSPNLTHLEPPKESHGLSTILMLVDGRTGEVKSIRYMSLSDRFTKQLFSLVREKLNQPFNKAAHFQTVDKIYAAYPTEKIVKMSNIYCKIS